VTAAMRQTQRERAIRRSGGGTEPGHWFESWEEYANASNHHHLHLLTQPEPHHELCHRDQRYSSLSKLAG